MHPRGSRAAVKSPSGVQSASRVISFANSCTTLRVTALLQSMTFGSRGVKRRPLHLDVHPVAPPSLQGRGRGRGPSYVCVCHILVLSQYVKDHFCVVEVVAMNVGSLSLQVSGIRYAPDSGVQSLRAIPAIDVDGSPDSVPPASVCLATPCGSLPPSPQV